jgi:hypothetical protein
MTFGEFQQSSGNFLEIFIDVHNFSRKVCKVNYNNSLGFHETPATSGNFLAKRTAFQEDSAEFHENHENSWKFFKSMCGPPCCTGLKKYDSSAVRRATMLEVLLLVEQPGKVLLRFAELAAQLAEHWAGPQSTAGCTAGCAAV